MFRNQSVSTHNFAMIPRADIPRSGFRMQKALKTTFNAAYLVPIFCEEVLPGDTFNMRMTALARLATPLYPVMDNLHLETFFFYVPNRLLWTNWQRFMGERDPDPDSSIDFLIPQIAYNEVVPEGDPASHTSGSIYDYFGLPVREGLRTAFIDEPTLTHSALPLRAYNLIWNEWFRDQNLQDSVIVNRDDGPDAPGEYALLRRGKRHDYFTSALPWPQKGEAVSIPISGGTQRVDVDPDQPYPHFLVEGDGAVRHLLGRDTEPRVRYGYGPGGATDLGPFAFSGGGRMGWAVDTVGDANFTGLVVDLSDITSVTVNQLRQSFQVQKLLERDARGGTRYTEIVRSHFGVISPDARLQRPEYLGGGSELININPVAQTNSDLGGVNSLGTLGSFGTAVITGHGFTQSFTEHGYVIGLCNVRADLSYQQGMRRHWSRRTRYDFYFPAFAHLGEQTILNRELMATGDPAVDDLVFGYQERWAEYRYNPSEITGLMRTFAAPNSLDAWHYSIGFDPETNPALNTAFIQDSADEAVRRTTAVQEDADGQQLIMDAFYDIRAARPLPMYSVPGMIDHF